eukprot:CAMPEP_0202694098 /NCGR_PEP_ID=MMETSP1385-20130828/8046_1 /ASSEMBLY_ACC=CAM_ASM_000861 /TAXON_ID=933848 /ORGANISM="Elphidium margaritaceum" /LENGTH=266 /DNA_ID=CAMNT_0049349881 /DNA_START=713 /DNA_END=1513 /DNA_ORIENTATION=-
MVEFLLFLVVDLSMCAGLYLFVFYSHRCSHCSLCAGVNAGSDVVPGSSVKDAHSCHSVEEEQVQQSKSFDKRMRFKDALQTKAGYDTFMHFLSLEFSTQNLLYVTEYIQISNVLIQHLIQFDVQLSKSTEMWVYGGFSAQFKLPTNIAFSKTAEILKKELSSTKIVVDQTYLFEVIMNAMRQLHLKYIARGAPFAIPVSHQRANALIGLMKSSDVLQLAVVSDTQDINQFLSILIPLFEDCTMEILQWLKRSFCRFKTMPSLKSLD